MENFATGKYHKPTGLVSGLMQQSRNISVNEQPALYRACPVAEEKLKNCRIKLQLYAAPGEAG